MEHLLLGVPHLHICLANTFQSGQYNYTGCAPPDLTSQAGEVRVVYSKGALRFLVSPPPDAQHLCSAFPAKQLMGGRRLWVCGCGGCLGETSQGSNWQLRYLSASCWVYANFEKEGHHDHSCGVCCHFPYVHDEHPCRCRLKLGDCSQHMAMHQEGAVRECRLSSATDGQRLDLGLL